MQKQIIGVMAGFLVALALATILARIIGIQWLYVGFLVGHALPAFAGGLTAGYIAKQRGWMYGIIVAVLFETLGIMLAGLQTFRFRPVQMIIHMTINTITTLWVTYSAFPVSAIIAGIVGGVLGQLLAQKWHKCSQTMKHK